MPVTRTLAQMAADLRAGDGVTDPTGAQAIVLDRIRRSAMVSVELYAPDAPDAIQNEAFVRVAGWLYDQDPTAASPGGSSALRASGAASLLRPYKVRRAGLVLDAGA